MIQNTTENPKTKIPGSYYDVPQTKGPSPAPLQKEDTNLDVQAKDSHSSKPNLTGLAE